MSMIFTRKTAHDRPPAVRCRNCAHFRNDAHYLESVLKGLTSLSSGCGSTRGEDGLCLRHDRFSSASSSCREFMAAAPKLDAAAG
jgi:hypothetical protein